MPRERQTKLGKLQSKLIEFYKESKLQILNFKIELLIIEI